MTPPTLDGKVAIVTGGSRGIGAAVAAWLSEHGTSVVVSGRDADRLKLAVQELESRGAAIHGVVADAAKREDADRLVDAAKERFGRLDILVNAVAPGLIETDMAAAISAEAREALLSQVPLKRIGTAREVAEMIGFLAGGAAAYVTGQVFHVNGGLYM